MSFSELSDLFNQGMDFIRLRPELNRPLKIFLFLAAAFALYRLLMTDAAEAIRRRVPWLRLLHGRRAARRLLREGDRSAAGEKLDEIGMHDEAIRVLEEGGLFTKAAEISLLKRRKRQAAELYERGGNFDRAAGLFADLRDFGRAEACLAKADRQDKFGDLLAERGHVDEAIAAYLSRDDEVRAAELLTKRGRTSEAADALFKAFERSEREYIRLPGEPPDAASLELGRKAAALYETAGRRHEAADLYRLTGRLRDTARCLAAGGDSLEAARLFEESGDFGAAAENYRRGGAIEQAERMDVEAHLKEHRIDDAVAGLERLCEFSRAGEILRDLGDIGRAAEMFEMDRQYGVAETLFSEAGREEDAARCAERGGDLVGAAEAMLRAGRQAEALSLAERVPPGDPRHREALALRGRSMIASGNIEEARDLILESLRSAVHLSRDDLDTLYDLASASADSGADPAALDLLDRMLAADRIDPAATDKARHIRELLTRRHSVANAPSETVTRLRSAPPPTGPEEDTAPTVKRYHILEEIGRGGMGVVYTAHDEVLDRTVALKILSSALKRHEQAVETFLREARAAASIHHQNVVTVFDTGVQDEDYFIAMELIRGETLKAILKKEKRLSLGVLMEVLGQLLLGLGHAHRNHVVHRDLTTNNLMWTDQGTLKIMDFGLAKIVRDLSSEQSIVGGTPSYMSPEQALGSPVDARTDIYSLGICIYEMWLGELPFAKGDLSFHHIHTDPPDPRLKDPSTPPFLSELILRCLRKKPEERFQSVDEIAKILAKERSSGNAAAGTEWQPK